MHGDAQFLGQISIKHMQQQLKSSQELICSTRLHSCN